MPGKKTILVSTLIVVLLMLHLFLRWAPNGSVQVLGARDELLSQVEEQGLEHPYGRPTRGPFTWEENPKLHQLRGGCGAILLMSAFQTILPDPLPGEKFNVGLGAALLAGAVVQPGEIFSMNKALGPYSRKQGFKEGPAYSGNYIINSTGGGVCKIATTLYNTAVLAGLEIQQRHAHGMLVPYAPPGQDATVNYGAKDFSFKNSTAHPIVIWSAVDGDTLTIAFYGSTLPPRVTWRHELLSWQRRPTMYSHDGTLPPGRERLVSAGADGLSVRSWLLIEHADGNLVIKELGVDYYKPMPRVIERHLE